MDGDTVLYRDILQFCHKRSMCQVRHLSSPEFRHTCKAKVFDEDTVVLTAKSVCKLPLPGISLVDNALIQSVQLFAPLLSVTGVLLAHGELATLLLKDGKVILQETRTLDGSAITHRHIGLQAEVNTNRCTIMCLSVCIANSIGCDDDVVFTERTALELDRLHLPLVLPR